MRFNFPLVLQETFWSALSIQDVLIGVRNHTAAPVVIKHLSTQAAHYSSTPSASMTTHIPEVGSGGNNTESCTGEDCSRKSGFAGDLEWHVIFLVRRECIFWPGGEKGQRQCKVQEKEQEGGY